MDKINILRILIIDLLTAFVLSTVACYILVKLNLMDVMFIGNLFGLYFLDVFAIEILIGTGKLSNNYKRFLLVIGFTIIFDLMFLLIFPLIFGQNIFSHADVLNVGMMGISFDLVLNTYFYLAIFALLMLIFNYILYRKNKSKIQ